MKRRYRKVVRKKPEEDERGGERTTHIVL